MSDDIDHYVKSIAIAFVEYGDLISFVTLNDFENQVARSHAIKSAYT